MSFVRAAELTAIKERLNTNSRKSKQFVFVLDLEWSDGSSSIVWRSYSEFFELQCRLLDSFPEEAGTTKGSIRRLPYLPGRKIFKKSDLALAQERRPEIEAYIKKLLSLEPKVSHSNVVQAFFQRRPHDPEYFNQFPLKLNSPVEKDVPVSANICCDSSRRPLHEHGGREMSSDSFLESGSVGQSMMLNTLELFIKGSQQSSDDCPKGQQ